MTKKNLHEIPITEKVKFEAVVPLEVVQQSQDDPEKPIRLEGLARTTDISLSRHKTTEKCIAKLKQTFVGLPTLLDHESGKVLGNIVGIKPSSDSELWPIAELLPLSGNDVVDAPVLQVTHWIKNHVKLGMSIHGWITEAKFVEDLDTYEWWIEIDEMTPFENSVTTIPAQLETKGKTTITNSCQGGICSQAAVQLKESLVNTCPAIKEALEENELRKAGKKPKLEAKEMSEEKITVDKPEFEQMQQTLNVLLKGEQARQKEAAEAAEKQKMADLKQSIKAELEEELSEKFTEAATLAAKTVIEESLGNLIKDRKHTRPSIQGQTGNGGITQEVTGEPEQTPMKQKFNDPSRYPAVQGGEVVQGVTAGELLGVNQ